MNTIETTEHAPQAAHQSPLADPELQNTATQFLALESKLLDEAHEEDLVYCNGKHEGHWPCLKMPELPSDSARTCCTM